MIKYVNIVAFGPVTLLLNTLRKGAFYLLTYIILYLLIVAFFGMMAHHAFGHSSEVACTPVALYPSTPVPLYPCIPVPL